MKGNKISKKLEELFNLPPSDSADESMTASDAVEQAKQNAQEQHDMIVAADAAIDKIDIALPTVRDLEASDAEMDAIAKLATDTFDDLVTLSMNIEPRYSGTILQSASSILGHAVTAKMAKMDKKLKMIDLQLKKAKLDQSAKVPTQEDSVPGEGMVIDRNELLRQILEASNSKK